MAPLCLTFVQRVHLFGPCYTNAVLYPPMVSMSSPPQNLNQKTKDKWLFSLPACPIFGIAGVWCEREGFGRCFSMVTVPPGPEIAPYHDRQIALLAPQNWAQWLDPLTQPETMLHPLPAGSLVVTQVSG